MGNIPYNISSQILVRIINARTGIKRAVLMFQKELAQRIMSAPGSKSYGRLSVMTGYCAIVTVLAEVKADLFYPKPNIDSLVLDIAFHRNPQTAALNEAFLFKTVKAAFSKRRKTLKNSLAGNILGIDAKESEQMLCLAGIDPVRRAETLSVAEFVRLADVLYMRQAVGKRLAE
jgi:16S rRNA (adenine1518-N6/adenine1519-N6)-dimethyltransferase